MPASFVFRNSTDTSFVTSQDLGAIATGISINPVKYLVRNIGDRVSVNSKIKIVADSSFLNISGTPILSISTSSSVNPVAGSYSLNFIGNNVVQINGSGSVVIEADGATKNTSVISGTEMIFNVNPSGSTASITVSDGYQRVQIAPDISGTPGTWSYGEVEYANLFCSSMTTLSAALIPGGSLGQTNYYYVVTAVTAKGETLCSNRVEVENTSDSQSVQLDWEVYPGVLSYNVYKSIINPDAPMTLETVDDLPTMTSNSTPVGYTAWSNQVYLNGSLSNFGHAYMAFENVQTGDPSACNNGTLPWFVGISLPVAKKYGGYSIKARSLGGSELQGPSTWTIQGSSSAYNANQDLMTWEVLDTRSSQSFSLGQKRNYQFSTYNDNAYLHYRIRITANNGNTFTAIEELEFFEYNPQPTLSGGEKLIYSTNLNTFVDNGTLSVNNSITHPLATNINSEKFWIKVLAPSGTLMGGNPRKFKLRAIGLSS